MIPLNNQSPLGIAGILGPGGLIASAYEPFEARPQQIQMAEAVWQAFEKHSPLAVEAGTGVGKSFAYLVPAINLVGQKKGKVLICTYTIALQEQLIKKDIPFLADIIPCNFSAVLAKGRSNYLCLRRLEYAANRYKSLYDEFTSELMNILEWSKRTQDGSLSELPISPSPQTWDSVKSEHGNCRGRKCPHFGGCFYWRARRHLDCADIIVANHALLFSDLVLRRGGHSILPDYGYLVIDEAHNIEHVAEDHFGIDLTNHTINFMLNSLYNPRTRKGALSFTKAEKTIGLVDKCAKSAGVFFRQVQAWYEQAAAETNGRCNPAFVEDNITEPLKQLRVELAGLAKQASDADEEFELLRNIDRCKELEDDLKEFIAQPDAEKVYWVEVEAGRRGSVSLRAAPINVSAAVKECLFDKYESVILTSATLSCDGADEKAGFEFFTSRIGLEKYTALKLGSPFNYEKLVTVYIESDLPEPNEQAFQAQAAEAVKKYLRLTKGRAFVLFTSYSMLTNMAKQLEDWLNEHNFTLLQQGPGRDRSSLLDQFKTNPQSVLFGTDSFWQGVDVPGQALSNVIIVRLPFAVPNHPLIQGRIEKIRQEGHNPFFTYQLPSAIMKFKQGFGRLVRTKTDSGIIVILDSRIVTKPYGRQFLAAIPKCKVNIIRQKNSKTSVK